MGWNNHFWSGFLSSISLGMNATAKTLCRGSFIFLDERQKVSEMLGQSLVHDCEIAPQINDSVGQLWPSTCSSFVLWSFFV